MLIIISFKFYIFTKKRRLKREKRELALRRLHTFDQGSIFFIFLEYRDYWHQLSGNKCELMAKIRKICEDFEGGWTYTLKVKAESEFSKKFTIFSLYFVDLLKFVVFNEPLLKIHANTRFTLHLSNPGFWQSSKYFWRSLIYCNFWKWLFEIVWVFQISLTIRERSHWVAANISPYSATNFETSQIQFIYTEKIIKVKSKV